MIELMEETANMLRGMCMDPRIPQDTKQALWSRVHKIDTAVTTALESDGTKTQFCWLVENGRQQGDGLAYRYMDHGMPLWTEDPHKAIRFARREDAEMFAAEDEDAWRIVEHGFEA